jgi:DNA-directed RNA polymerase specialized sigma24 family protein
VSKSDTIDAYVRQVLIRTFLDERRRPWHREHSVEPYDQLLGGAQEAPDVGLAVDLRRALDAIPPRQRAVLILRFWLDLPVEVRQCHCLS